jgi:formylglycine-generating enzyme required for sulfatase activity
MGQDVTPDGIHDLGGNVSEWTSSLFIDGNRMARSASAPEETARVIRGGSATRSFMARTSGRDRAAPLSVGANVGFRCASNVEVARP